MKIWAHTLFKNEERWLWYSVSSVINYVDRLLLWDTGSTDQSVKIAEELKKVYPDKIDLNLYGEVDIHKFTEVRQKMLDGTNADWFIVVDADEVWWQGSIRTVLSEIEKADKDIESFVVPTINLIGDIFHFQEEKAGNYKFGTLHGHYNLRAVKRDIPGLHSEGKHGVWGWADVKGRQIQDRNTFNYVDAPYLHSTFLTRGGAKGKDLDVPKRAKKFKYELGNEFPLDFYYPEVFFWDRPRFIPSPWVTIDASYKIKSFLQTPLRKAKRRLWSGKIGY